MSMNTVYPFQMIWTGYTHKELIDIARKDLSSLDREDMVELVRELGIRLEKLNA